MPYPTSPTRYLAPLALLAAVLATFLVVNSERSVGGGSAPSTSSAKVAPKTAKTPKRRIYVIQSGDTLSGIAAKFGVSLSKIQSLNPKVDATALHAGQTVKLAP